MKPILCLLGALALIPPPALAEDPAASGAATAATRSANESWGGKLPFDDRQDFEDARRGWIASLPGGRIARDGGGTAWDLAPYGFLQGETAPPTVNPSLWRQAQLNLSAGLFRVTDRVYQIRGLDLSNMDVIEGETGLIVVDPLISAETARAALGLYYEHRPRKPVVAVIYTHSHVDHFGGVKGVIDERDVQAGRVRIYAPQGFLEEAVSENIYVGNAMGRRAQYMYGAMLPRGERGQVDAGLGKTTSLGTITLIAPTDIVAQSGQRLRIDGLDFVFQLAPGTEAPAEMLFHLPQLKALCAAEDATHTLHNLYTLRGAQVRDAAKWWKALNQTLHDFGADSEVVFAQHHWPVWGRKRVDSFLRKQRDLYKYVLDQSLRLINEGYGPAALAEEMHLPLSLAREWYDRDYYGSLNHDAKAVYQRYLGWYDGNPANLFPLPPREAARRYVEYFGGADAAIAKARASYAQGDYRWVAEVMKHVVFADPDNRAARELEADALEQLGYQAENATWRNEFLVGAAELRSGIAKNPSAGTASADLVSAMTPEMVLDYLGLHLNGPKAEGRTASINWIIPESGRTFRIELENSVLVYTEQEGAPAPADATIKADRLPFLGLVAGRVSLTKLRLLGKAHVDGDAGKIDLVLSLLDSFDPAFPIVAPN